MSVWKCRCWRRGLFIGWKIFRQMFVRKKNKTKTCAVEWILAHNVYNTGWSLQGLRLRTQKAKLRWPNAATAVVVHKKESSKWFDKRIVVCNENKSLNIHSWVLNWILLSGQYWRLERLCACSSVISILATLQMAGCFSHLSHYLSCLGVSNDEDFIFCH